MSPAKIPAKQASDPSKKPISPRAISKPALVNWAANQERSLVLAAAADLNDELREAEMRLPRPVYLTSLDAKCGTQRAHAKLLAQAGDINTTSPAGESSTAEFVGR